MPPDDTSSGPVGGVSVVFVAYNQARFVHEAIQGLLRQTCAPGDIVILDDASTDATATVIASALEQGERRDGIRFIRNEKNLGIRGNMLKGFALAKGEFIILSCGDDVMTPSMVERMVQVWREDKVSLVTVNAIYIDENSKELNRFHRPPEGPYDASFETLARDGGNALCLGAAMGFEKRLIEEVGWPLTYPSVLDIMLPFSAFLANGARFIPEPLLKYRVTHENTSLSLAAERTTGADRLAIDLEAYCSHLAQSFLMEAELDRLNEKDPPRYSEIARQIKPLVAVQTVEMARKLIKTRIALNEMGVRPDYLSRLPAN